MTTPSAHTMLLALRRLRTELASYDRAVADAASLNVTDLTVLEVLNREGPQTPTVLAHRTHTRLATMTGILTRLERGGWVERVSDDTDRRSIRIHATSVDRFNALYSTSVDKLHAVFDTWGHEKARSFLSAISDISQALGKSVDSVDSAVEDENAGTVVHSQEQGRA